MSSRLGRQAIFLVLGDAITFASGIVAAAFLARIIPVSSMGTYRQIGYLGPLFVTVAELGLSGTVYRFWNALTEASRTIYLKMAVIITFALGLLASAVLAGLSPLLAGWFHNPELLPALLITALFPLADIPLRLLRPALLSQGYSLRATLLETAFSLISLVALLSSFLLGADLLLALGVWMVCLLARLLAVPWVLGPHLRQPGPWWDGGILRQVWAYQWPIQVGRIPGHVTAYFHKVVMSLFLSTADFAVYSLGARELPFVGNIGSSLSGVLIPSLVLDVQEGRLEQIARRWRLACERTAIVTYLIAAFCMWHAVPVVQFLFSAVYTDSSIPFRVFTALTFLRVIEYASLARAFGRTDLIMKAAFIGAGAVVALSFPLTWRWGFLGMAVAVAAGSVSGAIYFLYHYRRLLGMPLAAFYPWLRLLALLAMAFGSVFLSQWVLGRWLNLSADLSLLVLGWKLAALFAGAGAVYVALLLALGFVRLTRVQARDLLQLRWLRESFS